MKIGLAQYSPVILDRRTTLAKAAEFARAAAAEGCQLAVLGGEAAVPGYPFWVELTDGARFDSKVQKELFSAYSDQAVEIERGDLDPLAEICRASSMPIYLGVVEKPRDRGETLYCSLVFIDAGGTIASVHRKLVPTYEERLVWGNGDGHGLVTHRVGDFTVGGLNCWENWNPLARAALYGQGEDLHVCVFPGGLHNVDVTRFIARESRSFATSVCSVLRREDLAASLPRSISENAPAVIHSGGTCLAGPDGKWIVEPVAGDERLIVADVDHSRVREERQNFDAAGHYSRPDVLRLKLDRHRQGILE
jgi:nitrilase